MKIVKSENIGESFFSKEEAESIDSVEEILEDVRKNGDEAVKRYTKKFDNIELEESKISDPEIKKAYEKIDRKIISNLKKSAKNIRNFAQKQLSQFKGFEIENANGVLGQKIIPIEKVGCYVPGGRYPLPSSALMSAIPAKVAGVKQIIVCSPKIKPSVIVAADIAGADKIFNVGGIQAIGAMAFGTETIPKVDKIVGPGNKYVTAAKKEVFGEVGIDFLAGPSEITTIADSKANPKIIAADLLAQSEHDPESKPNLITTSKNIAEAVNEELSKQLDKLKTKETARQSLKNGRIIIVKSLKEAVKIADKISPEHLELQIESPQKLVDKLSNYGSLFIGEYSAEVFGDYCSGTNHILPTNKASRYTGGLSVKDFLKFVTYQKTSKKGANKLSKIASKIAQTEGLDGHKKSAEFRPQI